MSGSPPSLTWESPEKQISEWNGELIRPSLSMDELTSMQRDFLLFCQDDYTGVDFALSCVEGAYPSIEKQEARALTLKLIRELLDAGYIQAGDLPGGGERWKPLSLSVGETLDRIEKEWDKLGNERNHLVDIVWFLSTTEGERALADGIERNVLKEEDT